MSKSKSMDPITIAIVAVTLVAVIYMLIQAGLVGNSQKIAILDTNPLVEAIKANEDDADLKAMKEKIELKAAMLAEEGYVVLRSEMVRNAPKELYVEVSE